MSGQVDLEALKRRLTASQGTSILLDRSEAWAVVRELEAARFALGAAERDLSVLIPAARRGRRGE